MEEKIKNKGKCHLWSFKDLNFKVTTIDILAERASSEHRSKLARTQKKWRKLEYKNSVRASFELAQDRCKLEKFEH